MRAATIVRRCFGSSGRTRELACQQAMVGPRDQRFQFEHAGVELQESCKDSMRRKPVKRPVSARSWSTGISRQPGQPTHRGIVAVTFASLLNPMMGKF